MELYDIYVFIEDFENDTIFDFITSYLNGFKQMDDYFEYPQYKNPTIFETGSFEKMLGFILEDANRDFTFYFEKKDNPEYKQGIIKIYPQRAVCLGLSALPKFEKKIISILKNKFDTDKIIVSYNYPPPSSVMEAKKIIDPNWS